MTLHRVQHEQEAPSFGSFASEIHQGRAREAESHDLATEFPGLGFVELPEQAVSIGINHHRFHQGAWWRGQAVCDSFQTYPTFSTPRGTLWRWDQLTTGLPTLQEFAAGC